MNLKSILSKFKKSKFFRNFSFIYLSSLISSAFGFLTNLLIIKLIGIDVYGKLVTLQIVTKLITKLASARTNELTVRFVRMFLDKKEYSKAKLFLALGFLADTVTLLFFLVLLKSLANIFAVWFFKSSDFYFYIWFQGIIESLIILRGNFLGFLTALHKFKLLAYLSIFESISRLSLLTFFFLFFKRIHLKELLLIYLITTVFANIYLLVCSYISYKGTPIAKANISLHLNDLKEYLNFFVKNFITLLLKAGNQRIEYLLFSYFFSTTLVGLYDFIRKFFLPYSLVLQTIIKISYPKFVSLYVKKNSLKDFIFKITKYLILIYLVYTIITFLLFDKILEFLGVQSYINNHILLFLISFLIFFETITWWARNFSNTINPKYSIIGNFLLLINFLILWVAFSIFLPKTEFNLILGISIAYLTVTVYWFYTIKKNL